MAVADNFFAKDMKKNVQSVRIEELLKVVEQSSFETRLAGRANNKQTGTEARLMLVTTGLNAEEMSLLRDVAPNSTTIPGRMTCTWKLSSRFAAENAAGLGDMMKGRLTKDIGKTYEHRTEVAKGLTTFRSPEPLAIEAKEPGLWGKMLNSFKQDKPRHESSFGMG